MKRTREYRGPTLDDLMRTAANHNGCTVREMRSRCRDYNVVKAREFFAAACKEYGLRMYEAAWCINRVQPLAAHYLRNWRDKMVMPSYKADYVRYLCNFPHL